MGFFKLLRRFFGDAPTFSYKATNINAQGDVTGRRFVYNDGENSINIDGSSVTVKGNNIVVEGDTIRVNNQVIYKGLTAGQNVHITFTGDVSSLTCHRATIQGNVLGDVQAHQLDCQNIQGNVKAHQVGCRDIGGTVKAHQVTKRG